MRALVLAAGKGTRMKSELPKVLHPILGRPALGCVLDVLHSLGVQQACIVIGSGSEQVLAYLKSRRQGPKVSIAYQREQKGTGHAVEMARSQFSGYHGDVLIWPGDMPLLETETLKKFQKEHQKSGAIASVLSALRVDPQSYGRIIRCAGRFGAIREALDASESERRIQEINTGIYLFNAKALFAALKKIKPANVKNEFYLTDTIEVLSSENQRIEAFPLATEAEGHGINSRVDLAEAIQTMNQKEILRHQENGVTFIAPEQTYVESGVKIGADAVIYPWTYIEGDVKIGKKCQIGPFAKIRKGSVIGDEVIIGSFVEINRSKIGSKVMAKHLAYLGDAEIGEGSNIGAGAITANYDGKNKHTTRLGKKVFVGSNTVLVAPVTIGDYAKTGAGSVVTGGSTIRKGEIVAGVPARPLRKKNS